MFVLQMKSKFFFIQSKKKGQFIKIESDESWDRKNYIFAQKRLKMGSIIGHRIDYNGVRGSERPAAHTQQKLTQVPFDWEAFDWEVRIF